MQEWLDAITENAKLSSTDGSNALTAWGVISGSEKFQRSDPLTKQWAAYTLVRLEHAETAQEQKIHDIFFSPCKKEIQTAVAEHLFDLDNGWFYPRTIVSREEADILLQKVIGKMDETQIPFRNTYTYDPEIVTEIIPEDFDAENNQLTLPTGSTFTIGDYVCWQDPNQPQVYEIEDKTGESTYKVKTADLDTVCQEMDISGHSELNFQDAVFEEAEETMLYTDPFTENTALRKLQKNFDSNGYHIYLSVSSSGLRAQVSKKIGSEGKIYANVTCNGISLDYQWQKNKQAERNAYFKVHFRTQEDFGFKSGSYKTLYGDFSNFTGNDFIEKLQNFYHKKRQSEDTVLTLCTVKIPIPNAPVMNLTMSLQLRINASGNASFVFSQNHTVGFAQQGKGIRLIQEHDGKMNPQIRASAAVTTGIRFSLNMVKQALMDATITAGIRAVVTATVHLIDREEVQPSAMNGIASDVVTDLAAENPSVLACTDSKGYWLLDLKVNSTRTLAGKFGMGTAFHILDAENAPVVEALNGHFENGHKVEYCTRQKKPGYTAASSDLQVRDQIVLRKYAYAIEQGGTAQIDVTALPGGYSAQDLLYSSSDETVANVSSMGLVTGVKSGGAVIEVSTKDQKYKIYCNVVVKEQV